MNIKEQQMNWDGLGRKDPLWAICTQGPRDNQWDRGAFFATGVDDVGEIIRQCAELGLGLCAEGAALDFGCGVGRLTQPLGRRFAFVHGIDIAPSMIEEARRNNTLGGRCRYSVNEDYDLRQFADDYFDFVMTRAVLQHIEPRYVKRYLRSFLRILKPGGVLVFDEHAEPFVPPPRWKALLRRVVPAPLLTMRRRLRYRITREPVMEVYGIPKSELAAFLSLLGADLVSILDAPKASGAWTSYRYFVRKPA